MKDNKQAKVIAFYLPQFHPTESNDKWWGKGFTEWANVGKAKPLFRGHYQPKVPADLGYYDLRLPEVREQQAELAREAGIYGFCYYHYWFGNGHEELQLPFDEVVKLKKPDFPFMLCWANESWHRKFWDKDAKGNSLEMLAEQTYPGKDDHINHFYRLLPAFKDKRYIKIGNRPAFMIYKALDFPELKTFINLWNELARKEGFDGIYFIAHAQDGREIGNFQKILDQGVNAINTAMIWYARVKFMKNVLYKWRNSLSKRIFKHTLPLNYKSLMPLFISEIDHLPNVFPTLVPNWDHSPRSGGKGHMIKNESPELFYQHAKQILNFCKGKDPDIIFLKSWNEWGEGNYMEPDLKYGKGFIMALRKAIDEQ